MFAFWICLLLQHTRVFNDNKLRLAHILSTLWISHPCYAVIFIPFELMSRRRQLWADGYLKYTRRRFRFCLHKYCFGWDSDAHSRNHNKLTYRLRTQYLILLSVCRSKYSVRISAEPVFAIGINQQPTVEIILAEILINHLQVCGEHSTIDGIFGRSFIRASLHR